MTLYKYLDPERKDVIENRKIRYSQIYALNDPFEGKPYYETLAPDAVLTSLLTASFDDLPSDVMKTMGTILVSGLREKLGEMPPDIVDDIESAFQQISPTPANPNRSREVFDDFVRGDLIPLAQTMGPEIRCKIIETYNAKFGILCLSKARDSNLMWAHYAANSRGFVIGFNDEHPYFENPSTGDSLLNRLFDIEYSTERPVSEHMIELAFRDIILTKPNEWQYEKERRHIRDLSDGQRTDIIDAFGEPVYLYEFPEDLLEQVILGSRMAGETKENIIDALNSEHYEHVKIYEAHESETRYELLFEQIR